jgi:hypothetical protein
MELLENSILWCAIGATAAGLAAAGIDRFKRPVPTMLALFAAIVPWAFRAFENDLIMGAVVLVTAPLLFVIAWMLYDSRRDLPLRRCLMAASYLGILLSAVHSLAWATVLALRYLEKMAAG